MIEPKYDVYQVAKWFLSKESMTHKRLQKLCYYAEAWYFTLKEVELTYENYQAWQHGPVSPTLYSKFKNKGWNEISNLELSNIEDIKDVDDIDFLESVWNTYKHLGANSLEVLTHKESPWKKAFVKCDNRGYCSEIISKKSMRDYYKTIYIGTKETES